jgi:trigger factor
MTMGGARKNASAPAIPVRWAFVPRSGILIGSRREFLEGEALSSTDTLEGTSQPDPTQAADPEESHEHEGHEHGPVLNPECTRELAIDVSAEEVSETYRRVAENYRKHAKIPGFRPGKVPESVIRRRFADKIQREVIDTLLPERFNKAVDELGVRPVGQPQVTDLKIQDGSPLNVKAVFEYIPDFSIEGYQSVTVEKPPVEATEEEFQQQLDELRDSRATIEPVEEDRALQDGDWAQISYKGQVLAAAAEGGEEAPAEEPITGEDALVEIGGKDTLPAFNDALRGARPGQQLKVEVVCPADYAERRLAGKTMAYDVEVKGIKKRTLPELNDEFAKEVGAYENYAALEAQVREHVAGRKRRRVEEETKDRLLAALAERFRFPVPESLVQEQIDTRLERGLRALAAQGMEPEQMRKLDFARLRTAQRPAAAAEVTTRILLDRIAHEENITVSDKEVDREVQLAALQAREPVDVLKGRLTRDGGLARIREQLRREKTAALLYERLPA